MSQGGAISWCCCPFLALWQGTERHRTRCPSLPRDVSLSGSFPPLDSEGSLWLLFFVPCTKGSQRRRVPVSAAGIPDKGPSRRGSVPPPRSPAVPPAHISPRGDELCMAHRFGGDFSYSRRALRVWRGAKCPTFPHEPHRGRVTSQHFSCPFSPSPDFGDCAVSHSGCRCLHTSTLFRHPVALGKQSFGDCLLAGGTLHRWVVPKELSLLGTGGTCWFLGS